MFLFSIFWLKKMVVIILLLPMMVMMMLNMMEFCRRLLSNKRLRWGADCGCTLAPQYHSVYMCIPILICVAQGRSVAQYCMCSTILICVAQGHLFVEYSTKLMVWFAHHPLHVIVPFCHNTVIPICVARHYWSGSVKGVNHPLSNFTANVAQYQSVQHNTNMCMV